MFSHCCILLTYYATVMFNPDVQMEEGQLKKDHIMVTLLFMQCGLMLYLVQVCRRAPLPPPHTQEPSNMRTHTHHVHSLP